jgi:1,2-diacylglycerol 3-alpha-glucosyltransferase
MYGLRRLAIIWTNFGPYHLARILALENDFDVQPIELASYQRLYRWDKEGSELPVHTLRNGAWEDQSQLGVALDLWRKLSALRPSVVLVPGYATLSALCAALWGRTHKAATILMSESNFDDRRRHFAAEAIKRALVTFLFDGGIVGGNRAASYLQLLGMPADRIARAYDVVDNAYFSSHAMECRREAGDSGCGASSPYFLFVGRLVPEKNVSKLLDAFGRYLDSGGTWRLVIVGDGPLNVALHEQAAAHIRNGAVVFAGHKNTSELPALYAFAGCFVLPSLSEPWGLVVNEAMASGLPVIVSSRCGCADDLVEDGSNGFLVDSSALSIAEALARMSALNLEERLRMGERSQAIIANYSPERWLREVSRIVDDTEKDHSVNESLPLSD